jgi:hypothetical protein
LDGLGHGGEITFPAISELEVLLGGLLDLLF